MGWLDWLRRTTPAGAEGRAERVVGEPPSGNGASSLHLFWELPGRFAAAEACLEVLEAPTVPRLYFWALQASFAGPVGTTGGAHLGLQFHPEYPDARAVNWGGYRQGGGELEGTVAELPSALGNPNTRDFSWRTGARYRLRIDRSPSRPGWWRGSVREEAGSAGEPGPWVVVRELHGGGTHLTSLMTWSEVFARCEHPTVTVRWSNLVALDDRGATHRASSVRVNYQSHHDGGCANTDAVPDELGILQRSGTVRTVAQGQVLAVPIDGTGRADRPAAVPPH